MELHRETLIPTTKGQVHLVEVDLAPNPDSRETAYWQAVIKVNGRPWQVAYPPKNFRTEDDISIWTEDFLNGVRTAWGER